MHQPCPPRPSWDVIVAIIISLAFLLLNVYDSAFLHLWYDEGWTLAEITGVLTGEGVVLPHGVSPGSVFGQATATPGAFEGVSSSLYHHDVHPPVYFQALWAWSHVFGTSPLGLRSLSVVSAMGAAWLMFLHTRRRYGSPALLGLAMLLASPGAAYAAVNARGYGLALLLCSIAIIAVLRSLEGRRSVQWALVAGVATGVASITHYFTLLVLGPVCMAGVVYLVVQKR